MLTVLDLFSGIGGFTLGLERAGFKTLAFAEIDAWASRVLQKRWPGVPNLGDVTKIGFAPMSSPSDSPAKTSATPENAPELPESVPAYGDGVAVPFAWYDRSTQSWRTWQRSLDGGWEPWSGTWPRSGMTRNGIAYQLPTLVPRTKGIGSGLLPTPSGVNGGRNHVMGRLDEWGGSSNPFRGTEIGKVRCASFEEWMMGVPTGHTELTPSETPLSRKSLKSSGEQSYKQKGDSSYD